MSIDNATENPGYVVNRRVTSVFDLRIRDDKTKDERKNSNPATRAANYVTPGTIVTKEMGFMRYLFPFQDLMVI